MRKVDDYRRHAQECRDLAAKMDAPEVRDQLLAMAKVWEDMAEERAGFFTENPQFSDPLRPED